MATLTRRGLVNAVCLQPLRTGARKPNQRISDPREMKLPDDWQLLSVFEVEPVVSDPGVPWAYNTLTFETTRGEDHVRCDIIPGYDEFRLVWTRGDERIMTLTLCRVAALAVCTEHGNDSISLEFADENIGPLILQLKPHVMVAFSTNNPL